MAMASAPQYSRWSSQQERGQVESPADLSSCHEGRGDHTSLSQSRSHAGMVAQRSQNPGLLRDNCSHLKTDFSICAAKASTM